MHLKPLLDVALSYYEALDTPRSLTCAIMARAGSWDDLVALQAPVSPCDTWGASIDAYQRSLAATDLLRKCSGLPTTVDLEQAAIDSALESERQCAATNARVRSVLFEEGPLSAADLAVQGFFSQVRSRIASVLGKAPCTFNLKLGSGASVSDPSVRCTVPDKISVPQASVTADFPRECVLDWMQTAWYNCRDRLDGPSRPRDPKVVRGNVFFTVPKDSTKHRGAAKEPQLNGAYQLAVGQVIRRRLRERAGLDLEHGQELHRRLAKESSVSSTLATIDLSSASDTISSSLVRFLLPKGWWDLLDGLRSKFTLGILGADSALHLQKFSSMGNGFTFELETLIFWAIAHECMRRVGYHPTTGVDISVYGDDIIVPTDAAECVLSALKWAGLTPNRRKTFTTGHFRESCGGDFFYGVSVRSHFLKEIPNEPQHWISLANGIARVARQNGVPFSRVSRLWRPWLRCLDALPSHIRGLRGPVSLGDIVIHDDNWLVNRRFNKDGWSYIKAYQPTRLQLDWNNWHPEAVYAAALYLNSKRRSIAWHRPVGPVRDDFTWFRDIDDVEHSLGVIPRDGVIGYKVQRVYVG